MHTAGDKSLDSSLHSTLLIVPLVGNICTIGTIFIANGTIGKETGAKGKNGHYENLPMHYTEIFFSCNK